MSRRAASAQTVATRNAVAGSIADLGAGDVVIVGCSGGADSLALAAAARLAVELNPPFPPPRPILSP